jgi:hypothetical protein
LTEIARFSVVVFTVAVACDHRGKQANSGNCNTDGSGFETGIAGAFRQPSPYVQVTTRLGQNYPHLSGNWQVSFLDSVICYAGLCLHALFHSDSVRVRCFGFFLVLLDVNQRQKPRFIYNRRYFDELFLNLNVLHLLRENEARGCFRSFINDLF